MVGNQALFLSESEYLRREAESPIKHEYLAGQAYAMAGGSRAHNTICFNLPSLLKPKIRERGCQGYGSDMKVKIGARRCFYYPDMQVTCDDRDRTNESYTEYPKLIIEVLSDSTAGFDRGDKFFDYQEISSLEEYVLISQDKVRVEVYRRNGAGRWELYVFRDGERVELTSVGCAIAVTAIYEDVWGKAEA